MANVATNQFSNSYWQSIIEEVWTDELGAKLPIWTGYLDEVSTKKKYFEDGEIAGPSIWGETGEGQDLLLDDFGEGIKTRYEPLKFSKRLILPEELEEDGRYPEMYDASRMLANTAKLTQDYRAVGILNDAFSGANGHVAGDALSYCNAAHLIRGGSTVSNLMSALSPSNTAVATMLITVDRLPGSNGLINGQYTLKKLVGPSAYRLRMKEILKSGQKDDTANNAINSLKGELSSDYVAVPFMSSTTNWFGKTDVKRGALWVWRRQPRFRKEEFFTNETTAYMGSFRAIEGVSNWRTFIGVNV